jgi:hypothetical protein
MAGDGFSRDNKLLEQISCTYEVEKVVHVRFPEKNGHEGRVSLHTHRNLHYGFDAGAE